MSWGKEVAPLSGSEHLTMGDQMRAATISSQPHTSPIDGGIKNPRREFLKNRISYYKSLHEPKSGSSKGTAISDDVG